jgi:hypothetical protein
MMEQEEKPTDEVNIEEIMQDIRREILSKKRIGKADLPVAGKRFSAEFYEQLYQAGLMQSESGVMLHVTKSPVPILGPLIDLLRGKFHQLVLFYIDQVVLQQATINDHLLQAITLMSQELEAETRSDEEAQVNESRQ